MIALIPPSRASHFPNLKVHKKDKMSEVFDVMKKFIKKKTKDINLGWHLATNSSLSCAHKSHEIKSFLGRYFWGPFDGQRWPCWIIIVTWIRSPFCRPVIGWLGFAWTTRCTVVPNKVDVDVHGLIMQSETHSGDSLTRESCLVSILSLSLLSACD